MKFYELLIIAIGLSMDAFAVSICIGLKTENTTMKEALIAGLYFGISQAVMPIIGFYAGALLSERIAAFDHWGAFVMLCFIGGKMIAGSFKKEEPKNEENAEEEGGDSSYQNVLRPAEDENDNMLKPTRMLMLAITTSMDALAVGVSLAFLKASIVPAASLIGVTTLLISMVGVRIGGVLGEKFQSKAEFAGGLILVLIGVKILFEHLGVI